jgi:hypothetical protein
MFFALVASLDTSFEASATFRIGASVSSSTWRDTLGCMARRTSLYDIMTGGLLRFTFPRLLIPQISYPLYQGFYMAYIDDQ